jgi:hypothetical protein
MVRKSGKRESNGAAREKKPDSKREDDADALFRLPLSEFTAARKTLAARLNQVGLGDEADRVKALAKPSISAWGVNQLYWNHRQAFDRLIETAQRFRKAQTSGLAGKAAAMRQALDARRDALLDLEHLATALLSSVGHNPTSDTMRRITTTLEALSAYATLPDALSPGRLTQDVDPPGFELLGSLTSSVAITQRTAEPARAIQKPVSTAPNTRAKATPVVDRRKAEKARQAKIAAAKVSVQGAERVLLKARARAASAEAAQKKANGDAKEKEKQRREAEERFEKARAASEDAARHAQSVSSEVDEATRAVEDAERILKKASKELDSIRASQAG